MALETGTYIDDLNASNPVGASDPKSQGDDHIRLIKSTILATFPNIAGEVSLSHTEINDAARQAVANTFTEKQRISHASEAALQLYESDAGADEKLWQILANLDALMIQTRTDADAIGIIPVQIDRSGTAVSAIKLRGTSVQLINASALRIYNSANTQYSSFSQATNFTIAATSGNFNFEPAGLFADFRAGTTVRALDASNADYIGIKDTGSEAQILSNSNDLYFYPKLVNSFRLTNLTVDVRTGVAFRIYDATNADYISVNHTGTYLDCAFNGTTAMRFRDGVQLHLYNSADTKYGAFYHDDTNLVIDNNNGGLDTKSLTLITSNDTADEPGFKGAPQNVQNGNYTLLLSDAGKQIYKASGGAGETITIPANSSVAFPIGTIVVIVNDGGGDLSIAITTDTLEPYGGTAGTQTLPDNHKAVIEKVTSTLWKYAASG